MKVLQEASVIGRSFLYDILLQIAELPDPSTLDRALLGLEEAKLIYERSEQPDRVYMFKHAMTQEVAYSRLLRKERQKIHQRIGAVIERLFPDRRWKDMRSKNPIAIFSRRTTCCRLSRRQRTRSKQSSSTC